MFDRNALENFVCGIVTKGWIVVVAMFAVTMALLMTVGA